jgi:enoyl-CoA hydratase/carnithine racemase
MTYRTIVFNVGNHIAGITLNRPQAGNAVNLEMAQELQEVCRIVNGENDIYVVTLTGTGSAFCVGKDAQETMPCDAAATVAAIDRPVIAALNGDALGGGLEIAYALGGGLEIALAADIRIAAVTARFGLPQIAGGAIPAGGGTQRLPRIIGKGKALELLMTADTVSAGEALEIGLVSRLAPPEALAAETQKLAEAIAAKGPLALRYLKEAINKGMDMTLEQGLRLEADLYFLLHTTSDRAEGIKSYLEKRKPDYKAK